MPKTTRLGGTHVECQVVEAGRNVTAPLHALRVLELADGTAGRYCGRLLSDLGADVQRIEIGGRRGWPRPSSAGAASALGDFLDRGKRVGSSGAIGGDAIDALAEGTDVVVEDHGPGGIEQLGLSIDRWSARNPAIIVVRLSAFGQSGPYRDLPWTTFVVQAAGGWLSNRAPAGRPPVQVGGQLLELIAGAWAAASAQVALGRSDGGVIDLSLFETAFASLPQTMLLHEVLAARGLSSTGRRFGAPGVQRCRDGWVGINSLTAQHFADICAMIGEPEYADQLQQVVHPGAVADEFFEAIRPWLDGHDRDEIVELGQAFRVPTVPVCDGRALLELEHFRERGFFAPRDDGVVVPQRPYRFGRTPSHSAAAALPAQPLGEWRSGRHTRPVATHHQPFEGLRVLDLTTFWSGPCATSFLAAMGADVIKIEGQRRPDGFRFTGTFPDLGDDWYERSGSFQAVNLGKRGLALDLTTAEGQDVMRRLVAGADLVVENFAVRVLAQLGLSWEAIHACSPRTVLLRLPGYGLDGRWRDHVGWGNSFEQLSGHAWITGYPDGPPVPPGGYLDPTVGSHAVVAVCAALDHRDRTGEGQLVEVAQIEVGAYTSVDQILAAQLLGEAPLRAGNRSDVACPQGTFATLDDRWIAISVRDEDWPQWCRLTGRDGEAPDPAPRHANVAAHERHASAWAARRSAAAAVAELRAGGIPATEVMFGGGMYADPQLEAREFYEELEHPVSGRRRYPGLPMRFWFADPVRLGRAAPTIGQHNAEVLGDELGLDADVLEHLAAGGVIGVGMRR